MLFVVHSIDSELSSMRPLLLPLAVIALLQAGCDSRFRLKPKKGKPHPHSEVKFERDWVYKNPQPKGRATPLSDEDILYREAQAEITRKAEERYSISLSLFDFYCNQVRFADHVGSDLEFMNFIHPTFSSVVSNPPYKPVPSHRHLAFEELPPRTIAYLADCFSQSISLSSYVSNHLHYGDDKDTHYLAFNGIFPIYVDDQICRIFQVDIVRFGLPKHGNLADEDKIMSFFLSEDPSTDAAWNDEGVDDVPPDLSDLDGSTLAHPDPRKALFNFIVGNMYTPMALRFVEIVVKTSPESGENPLRKPEIQISDVHMIVIEKTAKRTLVKPKKNEL